MFEGFGHFVDQCWAFVDEACVDLHHIGSGLDLAHRIRTTQDAPHADDGEVGAQALAAGEAAGSLVLSLRSAADSAEASTVGSRSLDTIRIIRAEKIDVAGR